MRVRPQSMGTPTSKRMNVLLRHQPRPATCFRRRTHAGYFSIPGPHIYGEYQERRQLSWPRLGSLLGSGRLYSSPPRTPHSDLRRTCEQSSPSWNCARAPQYKACATAHVLPRFLSHDIIRLALGDRLEWQNTLSSASPSC